MAMARPEGTESIIKILKIIQTMEELGIQDKGLIEQMKAKLSNVTATPSWEAGKAFSILSEARDEDARKRKVLLDFFQGAKVFVDKMDEKFVSLLQAHAGNIEEKLDNHISQLNKKEYFLLVAGETCSGKSSLVNLILGEELVPYSVLSTTSTLCELKYGKERKIVAHFKDTDPETGQPTKTILLDEPEDSTEDTYLQRIAPYVHMKDDREKGPIFRKVELFWPHSVLQKGIVIIDSPGIGESDTMDEMVIQYLPQAFAFIYVMNCTNAGGIQKDRLQKLLHEVQKMSLGFDEHRLQEHLLSKCTLFVCNKWDQVPTEEIDGVKNHVKKKLQKVSPGIDPESQIIYISTKNATMAQNYGYITEDFSSLMDGVKSVVLKSIETRLEIHWRWLDHFYSRTVFQATAFVMNASRDQEKDRQLISQILNRLRAIENKQDEVMEDLRTYVKESIAEAALKLNVYLFSKETKSRFTTWTLDEVPKVLDSWPEMKHRIKAALSNRLIEIVEEWEEDNKVFANTHQKVWQYLQRRCNLVEEQLHNLRTAATTPTHGFSEISLTSPYSRLSYFHLFLIKSVFWIQMYMAEAVKDWFNERRYKANQCAEMEKISLTYFRRHSLLHRNIFVQHHFTLVMDCLKHIESRLPELIQADKKLYQELISAEKYSKKKVKDVYQPMMAEASDKRGQLLMFGIEEEVCAADITSEELDWKEDAASCLGRGSFAAVYQGTMKRKGFVQRVALKVLEGELNARNASDLVEETENLRKFDHPNIVKFYGKSLLKKNGTVRVVLVMERCSGDLRSYMMKNPKFIPGKSEDPDAFRMVCQWAIEITDALSYIHERGVVHRDLKLENILLSYENSVKIADVGLCKQEENITGTYAGTPMYMAPEVFHSQVYDCKADIYSLGIILWEMWYGQRAIFPGAVTLPALFTAVDKGHRPGDVEGCNSPPDCWRELTKMCWQGNPEERPTAESCKKILAKMMIPHQTGSLESPTKG